MPSAARSESIDLEQFEMRPASANTGVTARAETNIDEAHNASVMMRSESGDHTHLDGFSVPNEDDVYAGVMMRSESGDHTCLDGFSVPNEVSDGLVRHEACCCGCARTDN